MGVISYEVPINVQRMTIGVQGENNVREFLFDVTEWRQITGNIGTAEMVVQRRGDTSPYAAAITMHDENTVSWIPTSTDTEKVGAGKLQLMWIAGGQTVKTKIFDMKVDPALDYQLPDDSLDPWASWVPDVINAAATVKEFPGSVADATADWLEEHIGPTTPAVDASLSVSGAAADAKVAGEKVTELKSAINVLSVSNNSALNQFFRELYLIGLNAADIASVAINSTTSVTITFYNSSDIAIASFNTNQSFGETFISRDTTNDCYMYAYVDWSKLSIVTASRNVGTFSESVNKLEASPNIELFAMHSEKNVIKPTYTKTTSKRISTTGEIVNAERSWFYTTPIHVYSGDVVYLRSFGASSAAPISFTDSEGRKYTMAVQYGGSDPSEYYLPIFEDGYIAVSGYADATFRLVVYQNTYVKNIIDALNQKIDSGSPSDGNGININDILKANNHEIKIPAPIISAPIDPAAWRGNGASIGEIYDVWDNVNNIKVKALKVTSTDGGGLSYCVLDAPVNGNNYAFMFSFLLDPEFSVNTSLNGRSVYISVWSGGVINLDHRWSMQIQYEGGNSAWDGVFVRDGWWHETVVLPSAINPTVGSSFDMTNITAVGIQLRHDTSVNRSAYVANMSFVPKMQQPGIVTIIDNFDPDVPAMADYAASKGVTLNLSIIPGFYARASGAPTCAAWSEVERIAGQGHFIWNHTWTHQVMNNLTENQIFEQVDFAEAWMNAKGYAYSRGSDFVSVPSAQFNTASCTALLKTNAKMIFHAWNKQEQVFIPYYPGLRQLQTTILDTDKTGTGAGAALAESAEKAITYGGITIIGFHGTFWARDNGDSWKEYIDAIAELNCRHYTLEEIYKGMWN